MASFISTITAPIPSFNPLASFHSASMDTATNVTRGVATEVPQPTTVDRSQDPINSHARTLLTLPPEIRNLIFHLAVVHSGPLELYPQAAPVSSPSVWHRDNPHGNPVRPSEPALSQTCRQLRAEVLPVFYGENVFCDSVYDRECRGFLLGLTAAKRGMLRAVRVRARSASPWMQFGWPCARKERAKVEEVGRWMAEEGVVVGEGVVQVEVRAKGDAEARWTSEPSGECAFRMCCV